MRIVMMDMSLPPSLIDVGTSPFSRHGLPRENRFQPKHP
jgi:hypothetical protein